MPSTTPQVIDSLTTARQDLETASGQWSHLLLIATIVVFVGVVLEVIAFLWEIWEDRKKGEVKFHDGLALAGAVYVALFIGYEIEAEYQGTEVAENLRANNSAAQAILNDKANIATAQAVGLAEKVGGFDAVVSQTNERLDALAATASDQKSRSDAIITSLTAKQKQVEVTIEAARKDEAELAASANTIKELREEIRILTTKRSLTEKQSNDLMQAATPFSKLQFDLAAAHDSDSPYLAQQIGLALRKAGWEWTSRTALDSLHFGDSPNIGSAFTTGLQVHLCKSKENLFAPAINAIYAPLLADGIAMTHEIFPDADAPSRNEPCGLIHLIVGSRL